MAHGRCCGFACACLPQPGRVVRPRSSQDQLPIRTELNGAHIATVLEAADGRVGGLESPDQTVIPEGYHLVPARVELRERIREIKVQPVTERRHLSAGHKIPYVSQVVCRGGHYLGFVGTESGEVDRRLMPNWAEDRLARVSVPEPDRLVLRSGYRPAAIAAELRVEDSPFVQERWSNGPAGSRVPKAGGVIQGRCRDSPAVRAEVRAYHCPAVLEGFASGSSRGAIPDTGGAVLGGCR